MQKLRILMNVHRSVWNAAYVGTTTFIRSHSSEGMRSVLSQSGRAHNKQGKGCLLTNGDRLTYLGASIDTASIDVL